ncbi:Nonribosomal peptide synthase Pes1 [Lasiodiplodia theobromae]|uniref:Nonribosomal peptide synthase Pes1 n=1 Tax=Lasiodiplodia theobromae TaxID=45133 RepID=UPI0015C32516|nr:Nonribosomal peptide synthase Pes1 [Lasiodiplodia theobromae]KAF4537768.1 Nonribosomal peptide synthase Pes1 [Lasiodiplodia theobromae]
MTSPASSSSDRSTSPSLDADTTTTPSETGSVEHASVDQLLLNDVCKSSRVAPQRVLGVAWALVLRCYSGADHVQFQLQGESLSTVQVALDAQDSLNDLLCRDGLLGAAAEQIEGGDCWSRTLVDMRPASSTDDIICRPSLETPPELVLRVPEDLSEPCLQYSSTKIAPSRAYSICRTLEQVLKSILADREQKVGAMSFLSDADRSKIAAWNREEPAATRACIHQLVDRQTELQTNKEAICAWDGSMTYGELDRLSSALASKLVDTGLQRGDVVPVCFEKSCWVIVAMLGVFKAGGAFTLMDPSHPKARLAGIAAEVNARIAVTSVANEHLLVEAVEQVIVLGPHVLDDDDDSASPRQRWTIAGPSDLAFVIFTSGSTGKPKGIMMDHQAYASSAMHHGTAMRMGAHTRALQFASYSFGASLFETLTTLIFGGTVCIPSEHERRNDLPGVVERMRVTWAFLTPSVLKPFDPASAFPGLDTLVLAGEAMPRDQAQRWSARVRLVQCYGSSETNIILFDNRGRGENLGFAAGARAWLVDPRNDQALVPVGAVGELVVQGPTVARGYLNDAEKTAATFVSAPPAWLRELGLEIEGAPRMVKTGDLMRYEADGSLVFVGRKDLQVKIRGQRVELAEIERAVWAADPLVKHVVVTVPRVGPARGRLVAAVCFHQEQQQSSQHQTPPFQLISRQEDEEAHCLVQRVKETLAERLPSYMVPPTWGLFTALPLTLSGKVDRVSVRQWAEELSSTELDLLTLSLDEFSSVSTFDRPASQQESVLRELWGKALDGDPERMPLNRSFLSLGGDSISAMTLVSLYKGRGLSLTVQELFVGMTIERSAQALPDDFLQDSARAAGPTSYLPFSLLSSQVLEEAVATLQAVGIQSLDELEDLHPCSQVQHGMLLGSEKMAGSYQFRNVWELTPRQRSSPITLSEIKQAWSLVAQRHSALRSVLIECASEDWLYLQAVLKQVPDTIAFVEKDGDELPEGQLPCLAVVSSSTAKVPYEITAYHTSSDRWYLQLDIHHAVMDAASLQTLQRDFVMALDQHAWSSPASPFGAYVAHTRSLDSSDGLEHWKSYLDGCNPCYFPLDLEKAGEPNALRSFTVDLGDAAPRILSFCKANGYTVNTLFQTIWALMLRYYTDMGSTCFGYMVTDRSIPVEGAAEIVGPLMTMSVCHLAVDDTATMKDLLDTVQKDFLECLSYRNCSLAEIQHVLGLSGQALFNTMVTTGKSLTSWKEAAAGVDLRVASTHNPTEYDLTLNVEQEDDEVIVILNHWAPRVSVQQANSVAGALSEMLSRTLDRLDQPVKDMALLGEGDWQTILGWNAHYPEKLDVCVHDLVSEQVLLRPEAQAVRGWDADLSYKELDDRSNALALRLQALGVGPETLVPLCFEKSAYVVVAMLAVLKAGGACVALDPSHPKARLVEILHSIRANLIVTSSKMASFLSDQVSTVVVVDAEHLDELSSQGGPLRSQAQPSNVAFVVFTSGSTGKPKGIVLQHDAIATSARAHGEVMSVGPASRVMQFAAYMFDVSIEDIFTTLMRGGCVCIPSEEDRLNDLAGAFGRLGANWACLTPTVASLLEPAKILGLRHLCLGGEPVRRETIEKWAPNTCLNILYGPAECSMTMSCRPGVAVDAHPANFGHQVGALTWIVDESDHDRLLPVGCPGELLIEGPILAREYLGDEEKTAAAFVVNPKWAITEENGQPRRMYKTGDIVRYNADDGSISFVRRKDNQVKLHGQRIELGEIEHNLWNDERVRHAVVLLPKQGACAGKLVCVLSLKAIDPAGRTTGTAMRVLTPTDSPAVAEALPQVQARLAGLVPKYMVPAVWVVLEQVPLNKSVKMDRARVRAWVEELADDTFRALAAADLDDEAVHAPASDMERRLQAVWATVLGKPAAERVSLGRPFLRLGGDSIAAMQAVGRCRAQGIALTVRDMLECADLVDLARRARFITSAVRRDDDVVDDGAPFTLSPIQRMHLRGGAAENHFNQSFTLRLARRVGADALSRAVAQVVGRHGMLRARFRQEDGQGAWHQAVEPDVQGSYRFAVHAGPSSSEMEDAVALSQTSLDIQRGPVFSVDLFELDGGHDVLFLVVHHLAIDLVSWRILAEDLEDVLTHGVLQKPQSMSFRSWVNAQEEYSLKNHTPEAILAPPVDQSIVDYWGISPADNTFGAVQFEKFTLDDDTSLSLLEGCHEALRTEPVDVMISALVSSFSRVFRDREGPHFSVESHGREPWTADIDISRTVGWFTTMYPLPGTTSPDDDPIEVLRQTKDSRRTVTNNGWDHFTARHMKRTDDGHQHAPETEILFNYTGKYQQMERSDALLVPADRIGKWQDVAPGMLRDAIFDILVSVDRGSVTFTFAFSQAIKQRDAVLRWARDCEALLKQMVLRLEEMEPEYTVSDFPLLQTDRGALQRLLSKVEGPIEDIYPCAPMQQGLLLSQQKEDGVYRCLTVWEVTAENAAVDPERLRSAWQRVVDRHAALRTVLLESAAEDGTFVQVVLQRVAASSRFEATGRSRDVTLQSLVDEELDETDEAKPQHLLTLAAADNGTLFCKLEINHALIDGATMSVVLRDLCLAYDGRLAPGRGPLYSDYIKHLQSVKPEEHLEHWATYLHGVQPCYFPALRQQQQGSTSARRELLSQSVELHASGREIQDFCQTAGVTVAILFQVAWSILLRCFADTDDVCFGYLAAGRDVPVAGVDDAVGPFINLLACRLDLTASVSDALAAAQRGFLDAIPHQHTSVADVQRALGAPGRALFNTAISVQREQAAAEPGALRFTASHYYDPTEFDVSLAVAVQADGALALSLDYWTTHLSSAQAAGVASTLATIVQRITEGVDTPVAALDLFSAEDAQRVARWNAKLPEANDACVHRLFEQQAAARGDAPAIEAWDCNLSFRELDALASALALHLVRECGVGPETIVPFAFEKSGWALVAVLAVLKAGGACVALDVKLPAARRRQILAQTAARVAVASPSAAAVLERDHAELRVVAADAAFLHALPAAPAHALPDAVRPHNLAWLVFTSGSTGTPKGIMLEHRALATGCRAHGAAQFFGPETRALQFAAYTFDQVIEEALTPLLFGGVVCVPSDDERMNHLAAAIRRYRCNWADLTPTVVGDFLSPADAPSLRILSMGGEAVRQDTVDAWADSVLLINGYGPAECTVVSTIMVGLGRVADSSNIGFGVGCRTWVVVPGHPDRLAPVGTIGELLIEGPIVGRGYLHDPERTQRSFVDLPASWPVPVPGLGSGRAYATGDLVRYNDDGSLAFVGRRDAQHKLHGQRVEMAEIEHHARAAAPPGLPLAVEVIRRGGQQQLAAFLAPSAAEELPAERLAALRSALADALPQYMVPSLYVCVPQLPMTSSGKVDRRALRDVGAQLSADDVARASLADAAKLQPTTDTERLLRAGWAAALAMPESLIGVDDNFFRLGGDSVAAMRLVAHCRRAAGLALTVAQVFSAPVLRRMAALAAPLPLAAVASRRASPFELVQEREHAVSLAASQCGVPRDAIKDIYPCTPLQEGLIAASNRQPGAYVGRMVFSLAGGIDITRFRSAWETVVAETPILRTRVVQAASGGALLQVVVDEALEWKTYSDVDNSELDISYGRPLHQLALSHDCKTATWICHHALYDGWTLPQLLDRIEQAYRGTPRALPASSFADFIKHLNGAPSAQADEFWSSALAGAPATQFPAPTVDAHKDTRAQVVSRLVQWDVASDLGITAQTLLRAAWALVVSQHVGEDDVVFGMALSGRSASVDDIADVLGPTITTIPVRVRPDPRLTIAEYLQQTQDDSVKAMPFEHSGLQQIASLNQNLRNICDFQNLLVVQPEDESKLDPEIWTLAGTTADTDAFHTYPLVVECGLHPRELSISAKFKPSAVPSPQMHRILGQFEQCLHQLNQADKSIKLQDLNLLSPGDHAEIVAWNSQDLSAADTCVHSLVSDQVLLRGSAPALESTWEGTLSYTELDHLSSRLAVYLAEAGVTPGMLVPLVLHKSIYAVVVQLAVLRAGGACVPLDASHPIGRLQEIVSDCSAELVLADTKSAEKLASIAQKTVIIDAEMLRALPQSSAASLPYAIDPTQPAFVVFSSGSTGKPKGSLLSHRALCSSICAYKDMARLGPTSRVVQFSNFNFDMSIGDIFATLMSGGCICMPSEDERVDDLGDYITKMNVNWAYLTPTVANLLSPSSVPTLQTLLCGGEALNQDLVARWAGQLHLVELYGPSETTILCTLNALQPDSDCRNLGKGLAAVHTWIADPSDPNKLCSIGCTGELLIEGPVLANGYLNMPEKTNESFLWTPDWMKELGRTGRVYRSGDLVRYEADGSLRTMGRQDGQVKLHGQRLETAEVEHHLRQQIPGADRITVAVISRATHQMLAAFICDPSCGESAIEGTGDVIVELPQALKASLKKVDAALSRSLPRYMIPSLYFAVRELPLTANGKLDRKKLVRAVEALPDHVLSGSSASGQPKTPPTTAMEKRIQRHWAQLLGLQPERIGVDDSFLGMGGDSIIAMRLAHALKAEGVLISVSQILTNPVLSDMSKAAVSADESAPEVREYVPFSALPQEQMDQFVDKIVAPHVGVSREQIADVAWATDYQSWTYASNQLQHRGYLNYLLLRFQGGAIDVPRMQQACRALVARHAILRTTFLAHKQRTWAVVLKDTMQQPVVLHHVKLPEGVDADSYLLDRHEAIQTRMGATNTVAFTLLEHHANANANGTPPQQQHTLAFRLSHAQYDGLGIPLLIRDLKAAYENNELPSSRGPTCSFSAFVHSQHPAPDNASLRFWRDTLAGAAMTPILPHRQPPTRNRVDQSVVREVRAAPAALQARGVTFATVLKAAWGVVLAALSASSSSTAEWDVVFGNTVSGRSSSSAPGVDQLPGPCINLIPVRVRVRPREDTVAALLARVHAAYAAALPHEHVGLREIVERCTDGDWPLWTRFSSMVTHENLHDDDHDDDDGEWSAGAGAGRTRCELDIVVPPHDRADVWVWSYPDQDGERVTIDLTYGDATMTRAQAEAVADLLVQTIEALTRADGAEVLADVLPRPSGAAPRFPLLEAAACASSGTETTVGVEGGQAGGDLQSRRRAAEEVVKRAWDFVLGDSAGNADFDPDTPFYDVWGDQAAAAQLSTLYRREGFDVGMEELIDRPRMREQVELLSSM